MKSKSELERKLSERELVITTQLSFPAGISVEQLREKARLLKNFTTIFAGEENRPDISLTSLALALILKEEGIEPVLQINSRDKNRSTEL